MDGLLKDVRICQWLDPRQAGQHLALVLGKHSGHKDLQGEYARKEVDLAEEQLTSLLERAHRFA